MREIKNSKEAKKYKGRKVKWKISDKEGEGRIQVEEGDVFICQDSCNGHTCEDKLGYKYSWIWSDEIDVQKCFLLEEEEEYIYNKPLHPYPSWWDGRAIWGRGKERGDFVEGYCVGIDVDKNFPFIVQTKRGILFLDSFTPDTKPKVSYTLSVERDDLVVKFSLSEEQVEKLGMGSL